MAGLRLRRRLTYANVMSTLALVLAMSGTAYAVATVTSGDIVNRTIKFKDMSPAAVFALLPDGDVGIANDAGAFSGSGDQLVATLDVADDANVAVIAKVRVNNTGAAVTMSCRMDGGVTSDINFASLAAAGAPGFTENITFMVVEFFDPSEDVTIVCNPNGGSVHLYDLKIMAFETGGVSSTGP